MIRPYLIAAFHAAATVAAVSDAVRSFPAVAAGAAGVLSSAHRWQLSLPAGLGGLGSAAARLIVKSGKVQIPPAALSGTGASTATADPGTRASGGTEGNAAVELSVVAEALALFAAEGRYSTTSPMTSDGTGQGVLTVVAGLVGAVVMPVAHAGSGSLLVAAPPGTNVLTSGTGTLTQSMVAGSAADHAGNGSLAVLNTIKATAAAGFNGSGVLSVDARTSFVPVSMTKNGTWDSIDTTFRTITGWIPAATGYPGSTVSNNALVVPRAKTGATVAASIIVDGGGSFTSATVTIQLMVNGVSVAASAATEVNGEDAVTISVSKVRNVAAGDLVTVQAKATGGLYPPTVNTNAASYVRVT